MIAGKRFGKLWTRGLPMLRRRDVLGVALAAALAPAAGEARAARMPFADWLEGVRREARGRGIGAATLETALAGLSPIARVVALDRSQPEVTQTFAEYLARRITPALIAEGRQALAANRALLGRVRAAYGVQPRFVVALWGVETRYGRYTGGFPVIAALATLAYDARRSDYFRRELLDALAILDQGHVTVQRMTGSWAGAMGQNQFMPSSFLRFAVDFDGDGRRDIWDSKADVFASAANYLARSGWRGDQTWGREVRLPPGLDPTLVGLETVRRLSQWQRLGVRRADGADLPRRDLPGSVILPGGDDGPAFIVYDNYRAILTWNRSNYFAVSVGQLADAVSGA